MALLSGGTLLALLLLLLPLLLLIIRRKEGGEKKRPNNKLPPGPPKLPILGNLHQLLGKKLSHRALADLSDRYGPLMYLQLGEVPTVVVSSARTAREFLKIHDAESCSRPALTPYRKFSYNFSDVSFSPYGSLWRELRKICMQRIFNTKSVESFRSVREEEVQRMIGTITSQASIHSVDTVVNLSELLVTLSNNIICRVAFGKTYQKDGRSRFYGMVGEMDDLLASLHVGDYLPWARWVDVITGLQARLEKNFSELDEFYEEVIGWHLDPTVRDRQEDVVDVLLRAQKEETHLTDDHIKAVLMDILLGGTETSSATLEFAMAELVRNPRVMERAQDEVRRTMKWKAEESDIPQLVYLKAVVKETLRLHSVTPLLIPNETIGHWTIDGYDIMPQTRVIVNAWAIAREPGSWEMPNEFHPERFLDNTIDFTGHDFRFIPFGAGRRICPGMNFGIATVELALANLLYSFDWSASCGVGKEGVDMSEALGITLHLKSPLLLKAAEHRQS